MCNLNLCAPKKKRVVKIQKGISHRIRVNIFGVQMEKLLSVLINKLDEINN